MKKLHQKGEEDFKYNPNKAQKKKKFKIGDTVKMITPLTDNECLFFTYMIDDLTDKKCNELHKDIWEVTKVETDIFNDYTYNIKNKNNFELLARPEETLSKWIEGRTVSIGGKRRRKKTRKMKGGRLEKYKELGMKINEILKRINALEQANEFDEIENLQNDITGNSFDIGIIRSYINHKLNRTNEGDETPLDEWAKQLAIDSTPNIRAEANMSAGFRRKRKSRKKMPRKKNRKRRTKKKSRRRRR